MVATLEFTQRPKIRRTITGGKIRSWKSLDGRYLISEITSPGLGRWFLVCRQLVCGQQPVTVSRLKSRAEAERACAQHRSQ
jgi:hypothetical protein